MNQHKYMWVAILENNTLITEYNADGSENSYKEIPRQQLKYLGFHGPNASYMIDADTGMFHVKDQTMNSIVDVKLPIGKKKPISVCGSLGSWNKYNVNQLKSAHQNFKTKQKLDEFGRPMFHKDQFLPDGRPKPIIEYGQAGPPTVEKYLLQWTVFKIIPQIGPRYITSTLYIDPDDSVRPMLKVELRIQPDSVTVEGSPYEITL